MAHVEPTQTQNVSPLQKKVRAYRRTYILLLLTGWLMLISVGAFIVLSFSFNKSLYHGLENGWAMGKLMAADSSGQMIVCDVYNRKDTTVGIIVSSDSGRHFEQFGPWKSEFPLNSIKIAPDNKSVVALGYSALYIKAADKDSFTCIYNFKFPRDLDSAYSIAYPYNKGFCFVPRTDSLYVYDNLGDIFCLSFMKYDSMEIGSIQERFMRSLAITNSKKLYMIADEYSSENNQRNVIEIKTFYRNPVKYAIAEFNALPDSVYIDNRSDSTKKK
jgi:hypothetical protein